MDKPLRGVRILDLTRLLPGPYATLALSDLGADVVKVEEPQLGDYLRGISAGMFAALNRGKRSIALDLRADPSTFRKLCAKADVLVEGFRPGVFEKSGISLDEFPRLITVRLTGFGRSGPWSGLAGHDVGYIALAGVLARTGAMPGVQIADFAGGFACVSAVLAALYEREKTGRGRVLDVSLTDAAMQLVLPYVAGLGEPNLLDGSKPAYRVYSCRGGGRYALGALEPKFWARFCAAVGQSWEDRAFDASLIPAMESLFAEKTREEWDALLRPVDCCGEPVVELHELEHHAHSRARGMFPAPGLMRTPFATEVPIGAAPELGRDTAKVLQDWLA